MREIKFRAWDKITSSMRDVLHIDYLNQLVDLEGGVIEREYNNSDSDEVILMQYTGVKDINGQEIYEGDIIYDVIEEEYAHIRFDDDEGCFIAEFSRIIFKLNNANDTIAVVGNIYKNKDLIGEY